MGHSLKNRTLALVALLAAPLPRPLLGSSALEERSLSSFISPIEGNSSILGTRARALALVKVDKMLARAFPLSVRSFALAETPSVERGVDSPSLQRFLSEYHYFAEQRALVASVTLSREDLLPIQELLLTLPAEVKEPSLLELLVAELLTKVVAYRDLATGDLLQLPLFAPVIDSTRASALVTFVVEKRFDLWQGMPAFALKPVDPPFRVAPILLFRGTDASLTRKWGWASIISDLDPRGPGYAVFLRSQGLLHDWLAAQKSMGTPARVMGFSLGGALGLYALKLEANLLLSDPLEPSYLFNLPGISQGLMREWEESTLPECKIFISRGDMVSKAGYLLGQVTELSTPELLGPLASHVLLVSGQPSYSLAQVDVAAENRSRGFRLFNSEVQQDR